MRRKSALVLATLLSTAASTAAAQTFNFETTPAGTAVPLSITSGGLTATFTSASNFSVLASTFGTLSGRVLRDDDALASPLRITFSSLVRSISLNFAARGAPLSPAGLTLQALNGATLVGSVSATGTPPAGFLFAEGVVAFAGSSFDTVVLTSTAPDFAVDNVAVAQAAVIPEPATVALVGVGVLLVSGAAARRRRAAG